MSAIKEWFGIYNMLFRHMKETFGEQELREYLEYLADTVYADVSEDFAANGLVRISQRYIDNFIKDGGIASVDGGEAAVVSDNGTLSLRIDKCPAYGYMLTSENPYDKPEQYFCDCCSRLNSRILSNADCQLFITDISRDGKCNWRIVKGVSEE